MNDETKAASGPEQNNNPGEPEDTQAGRIGKVMELLKQAGAVERKGSGTSIMFLSKEQAAYFKKVIEERKKKEEKS